MNKVIIAAVVSISAASLFFGGVFVGQNRRDQPPTPVTPPPAANIRPQPGPDEMPPMSAEDRKLAVQTMRELGEAFAEQRLSSSNACRLLTQLVHATTRLTSPEQSLSFVSLQVHNEPSSQVWFNRITGTIRNSGDRPVQNVMIAWDAYVEETIVGSAYDTIPHLEPGTQWLFDARSLKGGLHFRLRSLTATY
jgi:hypothetical protein